MTKTKQQQQQLVINNNINNNNKLDHTHTLARTHTYTLTHTCGYRRYLADSIWNNLLDTHTHNQQQHRYNTLVVPTDWLLTIPSGNPPTCGDKCGTVGSDTTFGGTGDGRSAAAAAAAAATAAAAAATELAATAEPAGGGGARAELLLLLPLTLLPRFVVLWGPSCGVVLCARWCSAPV